jgi:hypothetical protein
VADEQVVPFPLDEPGDRVGDVVDGGAHLGQADRVDAQLLVDAPRGRVGRVLAGRRVAATGVAPQSAGVVLRAGSPLQQQAAVRVQQEDREGPVQVPRRLVRAELGHPPEGVARFVDQLDQRLARVGEGAAGWKG